MKIEYVAKNMAELKRSQKAMSFFLKHYYIESDGIVSVSERNYGGRQQTPITVIRPKTREISDICLKPELLHKSEAKAIAVGQEKALLQLGNRVYWIYYHQRK